MQSQVSESAPSWLQVLHCPPRAVCELQLNQSSQPGISRRRHRRAPLSRLPLRPCRQRRARLRLRPQWQWQPDQPGHHQPARNNRDRRSSRPASRRYRRKRRPRLRRDHRGPMCGRVHLDSECRCVPRLEARLTCAPNQFKATSPSNQRPAVASRQLPTIRRSRVGLHCRREIWDAPRTRASLGHRTSAVVVVGIDVLLNLETISTELWLATAEEL